MHRTAWTLVFALLLQLVAASAWAAGCGPRGASHAGQHHDTGESSMAMAAAGHAHAAQDPAGTLSVQVDSHHCCAVGLGMGLQPLLPTLPQATPQGPSLFWVSLSLRPDLPPPI